MKSSSRLIEQPRQPVASDGVNTSRQLQAPEAVPTAPESAGAALETAHRAGKGQRQLPRRPVRSIDSPYMTQDEAVEYLKLGSRQALFRLVHGYRLPYSRVGVAFRFDKRRIDTWVAEQGSGLALVSSKRA